MKKIVLFGDSITDMGRTVLPRKNKPWSFGIGYSQLINSELQFNYPQEYDIENQGISGNRVVDLYARIKKDVWNFKPDYISILIGTNDVWHEINHNNGVEIDRFEKIYSMMIEDTIKILPDVKIILCEPFILEGSETTEKFSEFEEIKQYAKVVEKIANKYNLSFVRLQDKFDKLSKKYGSENYLYDGVHPNSAGAKLIASEWLKEFLRLEGKC